MKAEMKKKVELLMSPIIKNKSRANGKIHYTIF